MAMLRISVFIVLCLSYTTIDANGWQTENHTYSYIHLPSDIIRFSVNTSLDFNTREVHLLFTSDFSKNPFYFDITVKNSDSNEFKIMSTCDFNNSIEFEPIIVDVYNILILYENGYIMIKHINGSTIVQSRQKTFMPRYFWYDRNIQISGCKIGLGNQCSAEYSGNTSTQPLEVTCALTECVWSIDTNRDLFEECDTNCEHKIANCTDYLRLYEPNDQTQVSVYAYNTSTATGTPIPSPETHSPSSGTHIPMNTEGTQMQSRHSIELISTADMDQSENNNTIGNYIVGGSKNDSSLTTVETTVIENNDTSVNFWNQLITAKNTEYCNTGLALETNTTNVTGLSDECSSLYNDITATQSLEEKCSLTLCIWKINNEVGLFEKCNINCTQTIANCIDFLSQYEHIGETQNNDTTSATGTSLSMNTDKNVQAPNRVVPTTAEPQHLLSQYNTVVQSKKTNTTTGDYDVGDSSGSSLTTVEATVIENNDTSARLWQQLITAMYTEYCNSTLGLKTHTTTVTGNNLGTTDIGDTNNLRPTDGNIEPRIHWTKGIILLIAFAGAGVGTFVIGSMFVLHDLLLQPRKGRKVSPEEAATAK